MLFTLKVWVLHKLRKSKIFLLDIYCGERVGTGGQWTSYACMDRLTDCVQFHIAQQMIRQITDKTQIC